MCITVTHYAVVYWCFDNILFKSLATIRSFLAMFEKGFSHHTALSVKKVSKKVVRATFPANGHQERQPSDFVN